MFYQEKRKKMDAFYRFFGYLPSTFQESFSVKWHAGAASAAPFEKSGLKFDYLPGLNINVALSAGKAIGEANDAMKKVVDLMKESPVGPDDGEHKASKLSEFKVTRWSIRDGSCLCLCLCP